MRGGGVPVTGLDFVRTRLLLLFRLPRRETGDRPQRMSVVRERDDERVRRDRRPDPNKSQAKLVYVGRFEMRSVVVFTALFATTSSLAARDFRRFFEKNSFIHTVCRVRPLFLFWEGWGALHKSRHFFGGSKNDCIDHICNIKTLRNNGAQGNRSRSLIEVLRRDNCKI